MKTKVVTGVLFFCCIWLFTSAVQQVYAAACPGSVRNAILYYNHQLLNRTVSPVSSFSQGSGLMGPVGIQIGPSGITGAGNNLVHRTVEVLVVEPDCDCLSDGESDVTVAVAGSCVNGVLNMQIHEVYPDMLLTGTCVCPGDDPPEKPFNFPLPGTANDFTLSMNYVDNNTVVRPYTCENCSGTYSWQLQFTPEPPPPQDIPLTPLVPLLYLLLQQAK